MRRDLISRGLESGLLCLAKVCFIAKDVKFLARLKCEKEVKYKRFFIIKKH